MNNFLNKILEPKINGAETAALLAELLNVKISYSSLKKEIEEHPDYPSLLSISDILRKYGIESLGIKFQMDSLAELPTPFITQVASIKLPLHFFTVVKEVGDEVIFYEPEKQVWTKLSKQDFLKRCSGIALLTEAEENAGEENYSDKLKAERSKLYSQSILAGGLPVLFVIFSAVMLINDGLQALLPFLFSVLTLFGALSGLLLIWYEIDQYNPLLRQICSAGKKTNCTAILQSKASKISGISWSIVGFTYFSGLLFFFLFSSSLNPAVLLVAGLLNIAALPYTVFSVFYQWRIAKQWCTLCLSVQAILLLQAVVVYTSGWINTAAFEAISFELIFRVISVFAVPFTAAMILVPALQNAKKGKRLGTALQRLKHNPQIFASLLEKQRQVVQAPENLGIKLGNPEAKIKMIKVCNPYCGPCAEIHKPMEKLLQHNPDLEVNVLYTASNHAGDERTPPVKHLLAIAATHGKHTLTKALDDWYLPEEKDYNIFAEKYPMNGELKLHDSHIQAMDDWCKNNNITYTPTVFIAMPTASGEVKFFEMPGEYSFDDLNYFFSI